MNSNITKWTIVALLCSSVQGIKVTTTVENQHRLHSQAGGIFGRMIEQVQAPEELAEEKAGAKRRKEAQLAEAEKDYQRMVKQEEDEDAASKKKSDEEAENAAMEAAKRTPQAQMLAAANSAASNINVADLESTIQAQLQAKLDSGATKAELLSQMSNPEEALTQTTSQNTIASTTTDTHQAKVQSVMAKILAKHKAQAQAPSPQPTTLPKLSAPPAALVQAKSASAAEVESKASQEKVREMAQKLGIPFTDDLMKLGSNSDISDSLIEKAVAAGKTEAEINKAMQSL